MCEVEGRAQLQRKEKISKCCEEIFGWPKIVAKEGVCVRVRPSVRLYMCVQFFGHGQNLASNV